MSSSVAAADHVPPLDWPHYRIGPVAAVGRGFRKYVVFSGRASRSEFWWWALFGVLGFLVPGFLGGLVTSLTETPNARGSYPVGPADGALLILAFVVLIAMIIPTIAITIRRLHDVGLSGWFYLINLVPYLGTMIVLIMCVLPTSPLAAKFGPPAPPPAPIGYAPPPPGYGPPPPPGSYT